jgi:hypothetical protein
MGEDLAKRPSASRKAYLWGEGLLYFTGLGRKVWRCMILKGLIYIQ